MSALRGFRFACLLGAGLALTAVSAALVAAEPDPQIVRLTAILSALDADPALNGLAGLERFKARQALAEAQVARSRDRAHVILLANAWVEAADAAAHAELISQQAAQLDRERDQILIEASRRDAEMARREADILRLQSLAREEEAQRTAESVELDRLAAEQSQADANAQAEQALKLAAARANEARLAREEAELANAVAADSLEATASAPPSRQSGGRTIYTLAGTAFASGSAKLTGSAQASLRRMAGDLGGKRSIRIVGHTDSQGADAANLILSQQRADAVRQVLTAAGVPAGLITATGKGETDPLTDNSSAEGRARNRRVEIIVE